MKLTEKQKKLDKQEHVATEICRVKITTFNASSNEHQ